MHQLQPTKRPPGRRYTRPPGRRYIVVGALGGAVATLLAAPLAGATSGTDRLRFGPSQRPVASAGALGASVTYLEALPGQPYYVNSAALCWQLSVDGKNGPVHSRVNAGAIDFPCRPVLPKRLSMAGRQSPRNLSVLVTATASKNAGVSNSVTLDYDLNGAYLRFSGTAGLIDNPFNRNAVRLEFLGDGKVLTAIVLAPASLPEKFNVAVAHVRLLTVKVTNISGDAPNWDELGVFQYSPGALMIARPVLKA